MINQRILAGDIGGTKTVLALVEWRADGSHAIVREQTLASTEYERFEDVLTVFLQDHPPLDAACFGLAGAVVGQRCHTTNLPWLVDGAQISSGFGIPRVHLLNDLEAMALGMLHLDPAQLVELNPRAQPCTGHRAVIAAGTGLGEAILFWDGDRHRPMATEGGHSDFSPQSEVHVRLLAHLHAIFPDHVSWERLLSGMGFSHLYDFLSNSGFAPPCPAIPASGDGRAGIDRNALISRLGVEGEDALCVEAVRLFAELYGAEAGNLALKAFATGGVYIGGGIAAKIRPVLQSGDFMRAFAAKGRFQSLLSTVSVKLALEPRTPLIGAMHFFR